MATPRRRLTAFEVSFPEERDDRTAGTTSSPSTSVRSRGSSVSSFNPNISTSSLGKRKGDARVDGDSRVRLDLCDAFVPLTNNCSVRFPKGANFQNVS